MCQYDKNVQFYSIFMFTYYFVQNVIGIVNFVILDIVFSNTYRLAKSARTFRRNSSRVKRSIKVGTVCMVKC